MLFRLRFQNDDQRERQAFVQSLNFDWETVSEEEKAELGPELAAAAGGFIKRLDDESWFKVDWMRVPELVEGRRVLLKAGKAYVPSKEQLSMVLAEFTTRLEKALELTSRALPRLDEDDRLTPILNHLSQNFTTPDASYSSSTNDGITANINAKSIDALSASHFPLCMQNLHRTLRRDAHLKHFGRLQYTLFLKGIGLSLEECLVFWRTGFSKMTDEKFNKDYRYNVRHAYGDVGGDSTRRGNGYTPFSCQRILTDKQPGAGESHGCPYRHFSLENLTALLQQTGVTEKSVLQGVKEDKEKTKYHLACNRYVSIFLLHLTLYPYCGYMLMSKTASSNTCTPARSRRSRTTGPGPQRSWRPSCIRTSTSSVATCSRTWGCQRRRLRRRA